MTLPTDDVYMQRCRVAAKYFFRYCGSLKISMVDSPYYDLIVEDSRNGLTFGVKVVGTYFEESEDFRQNYLPILEKINRQESDATVPIVLMSVDEETEKGRCGVIMSIRWDSVKINYPPAMREINEKNFNAIMNDINISDYVIRSLVDNEHGVLKAIRFRLPDNQVGSRGAHAYGSIVYKRNFAQNYKMNSPKSVDQKEQFERFMKGIPQEEYPNDYLDEIILGAVKRQFEDVSVKSSLFLFNSEMRDLKMMYKDRPQKEFIIQVEPEIDENTMILLGNVIQCPRINLTVFVECPYFRNSFRDELITVTLDLQDWKSGFELITQLKPTLTDLSKII